MRVTKKARKYIAEFSEFAAEIFKEQGWRWMAMGVNTGYVPTKEQIFESCLQRVSRLNANCSMSLSGRIMAHTSDFELGFRLYVEYPMNYV